MCRQASSGVSRTSRIAYAFYAIQASLISDMYSRISGCVNGAVAPGPAHCGERKRSLIKGPCFSVRTVLNKHNRDTGVKCQVAPNFREYFVNGRIFFNRFGIYVTLEVHLHFVSN